jgi:hypothetical protein
MGSGAVGWTKPGRLGGRFIRQACPALACLGCP